MLVCFFCHQPGHRVKVKGSKLIACHILRATVCRFCSGTGAEAHLSSHCPERTPEEVLLTTIPKKLLEMTEHIKLQILKEAPKHSRYWEGTLSRSGDYLFIAMDVELGIFYFCFLVDP